MVFGAHQGEVRVLVVTMLIDQKTPGKFTLVMTQPTQKFGNPKRDGQVPLQDFWGSGLSHREMVTTVVFRP